MIKSLSLVTLIAISNATIADQWDPVINMAVQQLKSSGNLGEISACIGVSEDKFVKEYEPVLRSCLSQFSMQDESEESEAAMEQCFEAEMVKRFGVSEERLLNCKSQFADEDAEDNYEDEIDYSTLSDEEYNALIAEQAESNQQNLDMMLEASKAASKGTEHLITLPVYQQSEIMAHYSMGMSFNDGPLTLPVATFQSADSVAKISEYYKKKLSGFQSKAFDGEMIIFMESFPDGFDPLRNMDVYQNTPHVSIYSIGTGTSKKSVIEIAYKKS